MTNLKGLVMQRNALQVALNWEKRRGNKDKIRELKEELDEIQRQISNSGASATEIVEAAQPSDIRHLEEFDFERPHWETKHGYHRI